MKPYLSKLCDEIDYLMTQLNGEDDWKEQILKVLHSHLSDYENQAEGTLETLLADIEDEILCSGESALS